MYETILTSDIDDIKTITFNRIENRNSINLTLLKEINQVLDEVEYSRQYKIVVLEGQNGIFCTGMDFGIYAASKEDVERSDSEAFAIQYKELLKRIALYPKYIISKVDGQVMAGGVGIAAASDLVIASSRTTFTLSEALWGLLPSMVLPYLIRRTGYQTAYKMTLTTAAVSAEEAKRVNLIDELSDDLDRTIIMMAARLRRVSSKTVKRMKEYMRKIWIIDENIEELGVAQTSFLSAQKDVTQNIRNFVEYKKFPWEADDFI